MQDIRLPYFSIEGCFGGSQSWMLDPQMRIGGCAALTACDLCIYLSLQKRLQDGFPLPCLVLNHKDKAFSDFVWHWFLILGCREKKGRFQVLAATYGEGVWLDFARLWDTGFARKGGLILAEGCRE